MSLRHTFSGSNILQKVFMLNAQDMNSETRCNLIFREYPQRPNLHQNKQVQYHENFYLNI
jgi:hypothetical protein